MSNNFYTAQQAAASVSLLAEINTQNRSRSFTFGMPQLDELVLPMIPGRFYGILACTGEFKTYFLMWALKSFVAQLKANGSNEKILYVSLEESIQEKYADYCTAMGSTVPFAQIESGRIQNPRQIGDAIAKHDDAPIVFMGESLTHAYDFDSTDAGFGGIKIEDVYSASQQLVKEFGINPAMIVTDYLQMFRPEDSSLTKREQIEQIAWAHKRMAYKLGVPVLTSIQARREVKSRANKIPDVSDAEHANSIAQTLDGCISLWRPSADMDEGTKLFGLTVSPGMAVGKIAKWRKALGVYKRFVMWSDYMTNSFGWGGLLLNQKIPQLGE